MSPDEGGNRNRSTSPNPAIGGNLQRGGGVWITPTSEPQNRRQQFGRLSRMPIGRWLPKKCSARPSSGTQHWESPPSTGIFRHWLVKDGCGWSKSPVTPRATRSRARSIIITSSAMPAEGFTTWKDAPSKANRNFRVDFVHPDTNFTFMGPVRRACLRDREAEGDGRKPGLRPATRKRAAGSLPMIAKSPKHSPTPNRYRNVGLHLLKAFAKFDRPAH